MKKQIMIISTIFTLLFMASGVYAAYHHEGEQDANRFLEVYPEKAGTKLDHCALCHSGGSYVNKKNKTVILGSCQWCHDMYGYDGSGNILDTMNPYGTHYHDNGRNSAAVTAIEDLDSDGDGYTNIEEINANRYPGDANDDPSKIVAPFRIYTKAQLEAMGQHTQFLLMNTSRSGDFYAEYTGLPMEDLLQDAGILGSATGILAYAPDGYAQTHPLEPDPAEELYHVNGIYPAADYYYDEEADVALNTVDGWCDYSAPSCQGRNHGDAINNPDGLKMILAYQREGAYMDPGVLNEDNKLDGEGPFRIVPPQLDPGPPDQTEDNTTPDTIWPYGASDHNAGFSARTATIIKIEPLPVGMTDIDIYEAGWAYVDQQKVVVYGAIDGTDSNGNGILDSEEGTDPNSDYDNDGTPDYQDTDTAAFRHVKGDEKMLIHTSNGDFANIEALSDDDPTVPQSGKPSVNFRYGATKFVITNLGAGDSVTVTLVYPNNVPTTAKYYKISIANGWKEIPIGSNDGDNVITITLTDGDSDTDTDAVPGQITDPGALGIPGGDTTTSAGGGAGCFISNIVIDWSL